MCLSVWQRKNTAHHLLREDVTNIVDDCCRFPRCCFDKFSKNSEILEVVFQKLDQDYFDLFLYCDQNNDNLIYRIWSIFRSFNPFWDFDIWFLIQFGIYIFSSLMYLWINHVPIFVPVWISHWWSHSNSNLTPFPFYTICHFSLSPPFDTSDFVPQLLWL